jgi:hypothetical protein
MMKKKEKMKIMKLMMKKIIMKILKKMNVIIKNPKKKSKKN